MLLLALIAFGVPLAVSLRDRVDSEVRSEARSQADVVAATAAELLLPPRPTALERLTEVSARSVRGRVIVVGPRGRLLADSAGAAEVGADYTNRPEVRGALRGQPQQFTRHSDTLGGDILATSVPILEGKRTGGAVRVTQSVGAVHRAVRTAVGDLVILAIIVLILGIAAGALIAQQVAGPIRRLELAARRVSGGDLDAQAAIEGSTEQRSLARSFNEMTERLARLLRSQEDFVADASHQLRTPVTGLRLRLEGLLDSSDDDEDRRQLGAGIREVDRLSHTVEELLVLSRAGERDLPGADVDVDDAVRRAAERWRRAADGRGIEVVERPRAGGATVWCAKADLDRAIDCLVENAIRYSPRGTIVEIAGGPRGVEVLDEGPGLEPGEEEAVFERFYRGREGRRGPEGTGLGLPIARELTREWGGDTTLASRPEGGLRASLILPARQ